MKYNFFFNTKIFPSTSLKVIMPFYIFLSTPALVPVGKISKLSHNLLLLNKFLKWQLPLHTSTVRSFSLFCAKIDLISKSIPIKGTFQVTVFFAYKLQLKPSKKLLKTSNHFLFLSENIYYL